MTIGRPAPLYLTLLHDRKSMCVREREILVFEFLDERRGSPEFDRIKGLNGYRQLIHKIQELHCPLPVVSPQEPTVAFRYHQGRSH
jgi:hypothetical protein